MDEIASTRPPSSLIDSSLIRSLRLQAESGAVPIVLFTDIDRTYVIQHGTASERLAHHDNSLALTRYLARNNVPVVAVTSRDIGSLVADYEADELPLFDVALTSLGSERFFLRAGSYDCDWDYARRLDPQRNWRKRAYPICLRFQEAAQSLMTANRLPEDLDLYFQPRDRIRPQGDGPQPYKISLNYFGPRWVTEVLEDLFETIVTKAGLDQLYIVFSYDGVANGRQRHNIDVLPIQKDIAARALIREIKQVVPIFKAVYAGDSRNDEAALCHVGDGGIVVGGYRSDIDVDALTGKRLAAELFNQPQKGHRLIFVEPDPSRRGPASVLEGLKLFQRIWNDTP